jgi:6-phosphogluconolactonase
MPNPHPSPEAPTSEVRVLADPEALAHAAARWLCEAAQASDGCFAVALAGGSTPRRMYELLAGTYLDAMPWNRIHWFFGDERCVPHTDPRSNFAMVRKAMFDPAPAPAANIHPIETSSVTPAEAAARYQRELEGFYGAARLDPARPLFDIVLLGLGEDGHTASLFPGAEALDEQERWVMAVAGADKDRRITLTYPALGSCGEVAFLVSGTAKRDSLARVWRGDELPAARLRPSGRIRWLVDRAADPATADRAGFADHGVTAAAGPARGSASKEAVRRSAGGSP